MSAADADELLAIARTVIRQVPGGRIDDPTMLAACRQAAMLMPASLRGTLREFRRESGERGAALISNLPVDEPSLPSTPGTSTSVQRFGTVPALLLMMIAAELGEPVAFRPEKSGALVQDVVPVQGKEDFQGNAGSVLLSFHNENAFHPYRPDFVMLLCLRADRDRVAGLRTACVREVLPLLSRESRAALSSPDFVTAAPPSFGTGGSTAPHAVLSGAPEDPDIRVDFAATKPLGPGAEQALEELRGLCEKVAHTVVMHPGDLAIVDNRVALHGRTAFRPRYDGADRWLQRTFVLQDFRRSRIGRLGDGHVID
ncbi:clavaminate synthase family protein [Sphaerisporangium perillae]|uniref:clavaminate synthase family protein n=1 Tax=Sphaerisporangium perillae TaxID=2935860 RepID=UPI002010B16B|nr:clavaminate synthase family protein [Sphaerisporangium perillae]